MSKKAKNKEKEVVIDATDLYGAACVAIMAALVQGMGAKMTGMLNAQAYADKLAETAVIMADALVQQVALSLLASEMEEDDEQTTGDT